MRNQVAVWLMGGLAILAGGTSLWSGWLDGRAPSLSPLFAEQKFSPAALARMEAALAQAGLVNIEVRERTLWSPTNQRDEALAALARADALPLGLGESAEGDLTNPFDSRATAEFKRRQALLEELASVVESMGGVVEATIKYDAETTRGLNPQTQHRALAAVRGEPDAALSLSQVIAIRDTIAASFAGMRPEDVTVTDLGGCRSWAGPLAAEDELRAPPAPSLPSEDRLASRWRDALRRAEFGRFADADLRVDCIEQPRQAPALSLNTPATLQTENAQPGVAIASHWIAWVEATPTLDVELDVQESALTQIVCATCPDRLRSFRRTVHVRWRDIETSADGLHVSTRPASAERWRPANVDRQAETREAPPSQRTPDLAPALAGVSHGHWTRWVGALAAIAIGAWLFQRRGPAPSEHPSTVES